MMQEMETIGQALAQAYAQERERLQLLLERAGEAPDGVFGSPVFGDGSTKPWLVLVGEAPGAQEVREGRAFVGAAGEQFAQLLEQASIRREDVYVTNAVKYRPVSYSARGMRNRTPRPAEVRAALPLLQKELQLLRPACVATLGNVPLAAVRLLAGLPKETIGAAHGNAERIALDGAQTILFPLYHPASVIYNRALLEVCRADAGELGRLYASSGK